MSNNVPNDQGYIIELLKNKKYYELWDIVKDIGYSDINDKNERFNIFIKASEKFDPFKNNNFILFYKNHIKFSKTSIIDEKMANFTRNQQVLAKNKSSAVSPTEDISHILRDIQRFTFDNS